MSFVRYTKENDCNIWRAHCIIVPPEFLRAGWHSLRPGGGRGCRSWARRMGVAMHRVTQGYHRSAVCKTRGTDYEYMKAKFYSGIWDSWCLVKGCGSSICSGIARLSGVYVPFSPHCSNILCPSTWKRKRWIISCAFWNLNVLKDLRRIVRLSMYVSNGITSILHKASDMLLVPWIFPTFVKKHTFIDTVNERRGNPSICENLNAACYSVNSPRPSVDRLHRSGAPLSTTGRRKMSFHKV